MRLETLLDLIFNNGDNRDNFFLSITQHSSNSYWTVILSPLIQSNNLISLWIFLVNSIDLCTIFKEATDIKTAQNLYEGQMMHVLKSAVSRNLFCWYGPISVKCVIAVNSLNRWITFLYRIIFSFFRFHQPIYNFLKSVSV